MMRFIHRPLKEPRWISLQAPQASSLFRTAENWISAEKKTSSISISFIAAVFFFYLVANNFNRDSALEANLQVITELKGVLPPLPCFHHLLLFFFRRRRRQKTTFLLTFLSLFSLMFVEENF